MHNPLAQGLIVAQLYHVGVLLNNPVGVVQTHNARERIEAYV